MEDYEKKYKEALEKIIEGLQPLPDGAKISGVTRAFLEEVFPELAESEDEKIRKGIIDFLWKEKIFLQEAHSSVENNPKYRFVMDAIAWLEKQGKEKSWKPSKEEMDVLYGLAYITNQYDEHKEEVITRLYQTLKREFYNGSSYENMFPNTSTEDDVRRRNTIQVLEYARSLDTYNQYGKADIDKNIAWLEKQYYTKKDVDDAYLKGISDAKNELEKQGEQKPFDYENANIQQKDFAPKQEWSEEDENYLQSAENACEYQYGKNTSTILWLKSLKDRVKGKED